MLEVLSFPINIDSLTQIANEVPVNKVGSVGLQFSKFWVMDAFILGEVEGDGYYLLTDSFSVVGKLDLNELDKCDMIIQAICAAGIITLFKYGSTKGFIGYSHVKQAWLALMDNAIFTAYVGLEVGRNVLAYRPNDVEREVVAAVNEFMNSQDDGYSYEPCTDEGELPDTYIRQSLKDIEYDWRAMQYTAIFTEDKVIRDADGFTEVLDVELPDVYVKCRMPLRGRGVYTISCLEDSRIAACQYLENMHHLPEDVRDLVIRAAIASEAKA